MEMHEESDPIRFEMPAALYKWPSLDARRVTAGYSIKALRTYDGTLADCVREFMLKPINQRPLYEIVTDPRAGLRDYILRPNEIVEISERTDFPSD
jgi:hypothetical protein